MNKNQTFWRVLAIVNTVLMGLLFAGVLVLMVASGGGLTGETPEARVREKISIDARDDAYLYNGADLVVYSDDHTTQKFSVDGATGNVNVAGTLTVSTLVSQSVAANAAYITATTSLSAASLTVPGAVTLSGNVTSTGNLQAVNITATTAVSTPLLTLEGVTSSGPVTFGSAASVVSGTLIAHGLGTTPTAVLLTPGSAGAFTYTAPYVLASNPTSFTVGVADNRTITTLQWLAGK